MTNQHTLYCQILQDVEGPIVGGMNELFDVIFYFAQDLFLMSKKILIFLFVSLVTFVIRFNLLNANNSLSGVACTNNQDFCIFSLHFSYPLLKFLRNIKI